MTRIRIAALAALAAAALAAAVTIPARGDANPVADRGIVVSGTGSVSAVPDRGAFSFTVASPAKTAAAAIQANAAAMRSVLAALKQTGIDPADLQTTQVSLDPRTSQDGQTIVGYTATSSVLAQLRDLFRAGTVVDAAVAAGADGVSGPSLSVGDTEKLYAQALAAAVADARAKAQALATAGTLTLGRITSIEETGAQPPPIAASPAAKDGGVPVEPGTQQIQAAVTVAFAAA